MMYFRRERESYLAIYPLSIVVFPRLLQHDRFDVEPNSIVIVNLRLFSDISPPLNVSRRTSPVETIDNNNNNVHDPHLFSILHEILQCYIRISNILFQGFLSSKIHEDICQVIHYSFEITFVQ